MVARLPGAFSCFWASWNSPQARQGLHVSLRVRRCAANGRGRICPEGCWCRCGGVGWSWSWPSAQRQDELLSSSCHSACWLRPHVDSPFLSASQPLTRSARRPLSPPRTPMPLVSPCFSPCLASSSLSTHHATSSSRPSDTSLQLRSEPSRYNPSHPDRRLKHPQAIFPIKPVCKSKGMPV